MTVKDIQTLVPGDIVYQVVRTMIDPNAIVDGERRRVERRTVRKVNERNVLTNRGSIYAINLITKAAGESAIAEFNAEQDRIQAEKNRIELAAYKANRAFPGANFWGGTLNVNARGVDDIERLSALLVIAGRAIQLQSDIGREFSAISADNLPSVVLTLSVAQAERVLASLRGSGDA